MSKEKKISPEPANDRPLDFDRIKVYLKLAEDKLRDTEEQLQLFRAYFEYAPDAYYLNDLKGNFVDGNKAAEILIGHKKEDLLGKNFLKMKILSKKDLLRAGTLLTRNIKGSRTGPDEFTLIRDDGTAVPVEISTYPLKLKGKTYVLGIAREITKRKKAELALQKSEKLYRALFERANDAVFLLNLDKTIKAANKKAAEMLGYDQEDLIGKPTIDFIAPSEHQKSIEKFEALVEGKSYSLYERIFRRKDGTQFPVEINVAAIYGEDKKPLYIQSIVRDITQRKQVEKQLRDSVKEKELLLKETHHRVKNNMQVMSSLLRLQGQAAGDEKTKELFNQSQNMIRSMALVHEKLYRTESLSRVDFSEYIKMLAPALFSSYGVDVNRIALDLDLQAVFLDINTAVPCSLIVNELLSNALKHAFPESAPGRISVTLKSRDKISSLLCVQDDGIGLPEDFDPQKTDSLGMMLVHDLIRQIKGKIEIESRKGTRVRMEIPLEPSGQDE